MSRNNEERAKARKSTKAPLDQLVSDQKETTTPLTFTTPTEFVDLPSGGKFYAEDHPLYNKDSLEIRYMTAKDEDVITSKSLLKKGVAIDRLLQNVIVDKEVKVQDLLIGDKNALVVATRITGYGHEYRTKVTCPACTNVDTHDFDLTEHVLNEGGTAEGATATENGLWEVVCPKSQVTVELGLLTGKSENTLLQMSMRRKKQKLPESGATDQLRHIITSVNGSTESLVIGKFINSMPAQDARYLRSVYDNLMPNIDLTQNYECADCGFNMDMEVPFTTDFFWPQQ